MVHRKRRLHQFTSTSIDHAGISNIGARTCILAETSMILSIGVPGGQKSSANMYAVSIHAVKIRSESVSRNISPRMVGRNSLIVTAELDISNYKMRSIDIDSTNGSRMRGHVSRTIFPYLTSLDANQSGMLSKQGIGHRLPPLRMSRPLDLRRSWRCL